MKIFKNNSPLWTAIVIVGLLFLISQLFFVDHSYSEKPKDVNFPENKTVFFTVKESQFSIRKNGFDYLLNSLKLWDYDSSKNIVYLREPTLMPDKYTPLLVIYDKGSDTYDKQENIIPMSTFPFSLKNTGSSLQINRIDSNGKVYFQYRDKELALNPGQTYWLPFYEGFQFKWVTIQNHGLFDTKKQFKLLKEGSDINN